ncbi:hypothetical protein F4805DRAFT_50572 [Annulohypoxylon moriforme]|nr:hypothetical protein F4805DRAFT_50572 [Annulohypoxylon moriforme]
MTQQGAERRQRRRTRLGRGRGRGSRRGRLIVNDGGQRTSFRSGIIIPLGSFFSFGERGYELPEKAVLTVNADVVVDAGRGLVHLVPGRVAVFPERTVLSLPGGTIRSPRNPSASSIDVRPGTLVCLGPPPTDRSDEQMSPLSHGILLAVNWTVPVGHQLLLPPNKSLVVGDHGLWSAESIVLKADTTLGDSLFTTAAIEIPLGRTITIPHDKIIKILDRNAVKHRMGEIMSKMSDIEVETTPLGNIFKPGTVFPPCVIIPSGTVLPSGMTIPGGTAIPSGTVLPPETTLLGRTVLSAGTIVPAGTMVPNHVSLPGFNVA